MKMIEVAEVKQRWISVAQAAIRAGVVERTIRRWLADGSLRAHRPAGGRRVLIELAELDRLIEEGAAESA